MIGGRIEQKDPDALVDFFSLIDENAEPKAKRRRKSVRPRPAIEPRPKSLVIQGREGGFSLVAGAGAKNWAYPCQLRVRCAYDIIGADPTNIASSARVRSNARRAHGRAGHNCLRCGPAVVQWHPDAICRIR